MDLTGLVGSAFLDVHGRFAKEQEDLVTVRLWLPDVTDLTLAEFNALTSDERDQIRNAASGHVDTEGKSNA